jgi:hypothetical protein
MVKDGINTISGESPAGSLSVVGGKSAYTTVLGGDSTGYIYGYIDDSFICGGSNEVDVTIEYYDAAANVGKTLELAYHAVSTQWKYMPKLIMQGTNTWKTITYNITDARFENGLNGYTDFRIATKAPISFHKIAITKKIKDVTIPPEVTFTNPATKVNMTTWIGDQGTATYVTLLDKPALQVGTTGQAKYIYGNIDDAYLYDGKNKVIVTIEYFDSKGDGSWTMAYNSVDAAWAYLDPVVLRGTETWKTQQYILEDARFANLCNGADFRIGANNVPVAFHKIKVEKVNSVILGTQFDKMANLYFDGDIVKFDLKLTNQKANSEELTVQYKVLNHNNTSVYEGSFVQSVGAKAEVTKGVELGTFLKGSYFLTISASNSDKSVNINEKYRFAVIKDISDKEFTIDNFGACVHFAQNKGDINILTNLFKQAGITTLRDEYYWNRVETVKGQYTWAYDNYVNKLVDNGQEMLIILSYGNNLYGGGLPLTDAARQGFANYAGALAAHLKGKVKYFEVWNEWNGGGGSSAYNYYLLLRDTYLAVKAANPDAQIVGAATVGYDYTFMKNLVDYGGWQYMDGISYHYPDRTRLTELSDQIEDYIFNTYGKEIPAWITEIGWANEFVEKGGKTELESTAYITQLYIDNHSNPDAHEMIYYYDFQNDGTNPAEHEQNFGLVSLEAGGAAKPSFVALNAAADLLNGTTFETSYNDLIPDLRIHKFNVDNSETDIMSIWTMKGQIPVNLNLGTGSFEVIDTFGNVVPYSIINNSLSITATELPIYVRGNFEAAPTVGELGFVAEYDTMEVVPGEELSIKVLRSQDAQTLSGNYDIRIPDGWSVISGATFAAGSTEDIIVLKVGENYTATTGKIEIYPTSLSGEVYGNIAITVKTVDSFTIEVSPVIKSTGDGWDVRIRLMNHYSTASISKGTVTIEEPSLCAGVYEFPEIGPKSYYDLLIPATMLTGDWTTSFTFNVRTEDGFAKNITRAVSTLTAVRTDTSDNIQIDGIINNSEWKNAMGFVLDKASQTKGFTTSSPWGGADDLSAVGKVKWDDEYLYLSVNVTDNVHYMEDTFDFSWQADSVQISIDPGRVAGYNSIGHHRFNFALNSETGESKIVVDGTDLAELSDNLLKESLSKVTRDEENKKTNYELALKWSEILPASMMPAAADLTDIGFSLLVNDSDGATRRGWIEYMSGIGYGKLPALFGDLILTNFQSISVPGVEEPGGDDYTIPPKEGDFVTQTQMSVADTSISRAGRDSSYLLDSNLFTRWESAGAPHWITLDLGQSYNVNSIWYQSQRDYDGGTIFRYSVYVGDDLDNLTKIVDGAQAPAYIHGSTYQTIGEYALEFPDNVSGTGRYVKLEILESKYGDCRISEINVGFNPVQAPVETGIEILSLPYKTEYMVGDSLDLSGLMVNINYDILEPASLVITPDMVSGFDPSVAGNQTVVITYHGFTAEFVVNVIENPPIILIPIIDHNKPLNNDVTDAVSAALNELEATFAAGVDLYKAKAMVNTSSEIANLISNIMGIPGNNVILNEVLDTMVKMKDAAAQLTNPSAVYDSADAANKMIQNVALNIGALHSVDDIKAVTEIVDLAAQLVIQALPILTAEQADVLKEDLIANASKYIDLHSGAAKESDVLEKTLEAIMTIEPSITTEQKESSENIL